jgi:intracellular sulfur oxidation DsrE/DsrF family protein
VCSFIQAGIFHSEIASRSRLIRQQGSHDMSDANHAINIDVPVELKSVKSVHSIGSLQFEGDLPAAIFHLQLITNDIADWGADSEVIVVFHTNAGHLTLHDEAYNASRKIAAGNPNKDLIADLMKRGVKVELCGATAEAIGWGNADLLPNVKINMDAMARTIQLVQQGFVKITEA